MFTINIPVTDYLRRVFHAANVSRYAGVLVVIARSADTGHLLAQVIGSWDSLHGVTRRHLAVVCPTEYRTMGTSVHAGSGVFLANHELRATIPKDGRPSRR